MTKLQKAAAAYMAARANNAKKVQEAAEAEHALGDAEAELLKTIENHGQDGQAVVINGAAIILQEEYWNRPRGDMLRVYYLMEPPASVSAP